MKVDQVESLRKQMKVRIDELQHELARGQVRLREVEREEVYLREMLLRISGAIQVLGELMAESEQAAAAGNGGERVLTRSGGGNDTGPATALGDAGDSSSAWKSSGGPHGGNEKRKPKI